MFRKSSKVQYAKYKGFGHIFVNCTSKPLVLQEHKDIDENEDYCVQVYKLNPEDFSNLDEKDVQKEGRNTTTSNEFENEVNKENNNSTLVVDEEVLGNSLEKLLEEVNIIIEGSYDISLLKLPDSPSTMHDVQHAKGLKQHVPHPLMLDVQHVISLEQHVELPNPLPLIRDEKDKDNSNLVDYVQTISTKASNSICSTPHPQSYNFHSYEPKKHVELLSIYPHSKMFDSTESFTYRVYNLHIKIIKYIQVSNEQ